MELRKEKTITVFGSARPVEGDLQYEEGRAVGKALASAGYTVCNGGYGGTMEATARGAKEGGGTTIGVVARYFSLHANRWIDRKIVVEDLVERLMKLISLGDAYVVLRGGTGTMLELAAAWEFLNKGILQEKPLIFVGNFWTNIVDILSNELHLEGRETPYISTVQTAGELITVLDKKFNAG